MILEWEVTYGFRLVPELVNLNGLLAVTVHYITRNGIFGANCVKFTEARSVLAATKMCRLGIILAIYDLTGSTCSLSVVAEFLVSGSLAEMLFVL